MLKVFSFEGKKSGTHLLCLGGIHGNEPCGVHALRRIVAMFEGGEATLDAGRVTFIPACNEKAFDRDIIYIDENLNRCVRKYDAPATHEQKVAHELTRYIDDCDMVIDLHSTTAPTRPFGFLDTDCKTGRDLARAIGLETVLIGWPALYPGDDSPTTLTYAESIGKTGLTIECGQHRDPQAQEQAENFVWRALAHLGMTHHRPAVASDPNYLVMTEVVYQQGGYALQKDYKNFDRLKDGEVVAANGQGETLRAPQNSFIVMPKATAKAGEELYYLAVSG